MPTAAELEKAVDKLQRTKVRDLLARGARPNSKNAAGEPLFYRVIIQLWNARIDGDREKEATAREIGSAFVQSGARLDIFTAAILGYLVETRALLRSNPALARQRFPVNNHTVSDLATWCGAPQTVLALLSKAKRSGATFDWREAERGLHEATLEAIGRIVSKREGVVWSALGFDCDSGNGSLGIKLNDAAHRIELNARTSVGDFSNGRELDGEPKVRDLLAECKSSDRNRRRFMDLVCRVALELEQEGFSPAMRRSSDFELFVTDHDEPLESSAGRLHRVRRKLRSAVAKPAAETRSQRSAGSSGRAPFRLELREGASQKFWEISLEGSSHTVHFGRIGADGQTKTKAFDSPEAAQKDTYKLIAEKRKRGYVRVRPPAPPAQNRP